LSRPAGSQQDLQVGPHDPLNPTDAGKPHEFVEPHPSALSIEPERLNGNIETELVAVFETVCKRFFRAVDRHRNMIQLVGFDACGKGIACEPEHSHRGVVQSRWLRTPRESDVDGVRDNLLLVFSDFLHHFLILSLYD
jgi:hypothetical protein